MKKAATALLAALLLVEPGLPLQAGEYLGRAEVEALIEELAAEGLDPERIRTLLGQAQRQERILEAIARPAEKVLTWAQYRKIFVQQSRIDQGEQFRAEFGEALSRAEKETGVPVEMILAIIGVETRYGRQRGSYRVIDALATLGFDYPPRASFFRGQLKELFRLEKKAHIDAGTITGSYAGAMGYPQFIPSSYLNYAVDFNNDGVTDLVNSPVDAIGSVANYFREHGWQPGLPVAARARVEGEEYRSRINTRGKPDMTLKEAARAGARPLSCKESTHCFKKLAKDTPVALIELEGDQGSEFWLVTQNFYTITRYNHSVLYAMAAYQLSREFEDKR